jgi:hypothetical protein
MAQIPSWGTNIHLVSQKYPSPLTELEGSLGCLQWPDNGLYPEPDESSPQIHTPLLRPSLILFSHLLLERAVVAQSV